MAYAWVWFGGGVPATNESVSEKGTGQVSKKSVEQQPSLPTPSPIVEKEATFRQPTPVVRSSGDGEPPAEKRAPVARKVPAAVSFSKELSTGLGAEAPDFKLPPEVKAALSDTAGIKDIAANPQELARRIQELDPSPERLKELRAFAEVFVDLPPDNGPSRRP